MYEYVLFSVLQVKHYMQITSDLLYITFCRKLIEPKIEAKNRTLNRAYILNSINISMNRFSPHWYAELKALSSHGKGPT
jgi:hypothetical protein